MRQAFTRKHAENQLRYLWRPVIVLALIFVLVGCHPVDQDSSSDGFDQRKESSYPSALNSESQIQTPTVSAVATQTATLTPQPPTPAEAVVTATVEPTRQPVLAPPPSSDSVSAQAASGGSELGRVTGYYCSQVEGYPIWDGGGYCGGMSSGKTVYAGAAACGARWQLGQRLEISGYGTVVCEDRGYLEFSQVDIFFDTNQSLYSSGVSNRRMQITEVP